jgi:hypothetical protein
MDRRDAANTGSVLPTRSASLGGLYLLSLDGGGVRGLSSLMILQQLMERINPNNPPKPCDFFNMIGGTSTGGIIAIMLGRMQMSVDQCIAAYKELSDTVFTKVRSRVNWRGSAQGRFNEETLSAAVKETLVKYGLAENELLRNPSESVCKTWVFLQLLHVIPQADKDLRRC